MPWVDMVGFHLVLLVCGTRGRLNGVGEGAVLFGPWLGCWE